MADETAVLQMLRLLPMVEALHDEGFRLVHSGGGHAPDHFVRRANAHVERTVELSGDQFVAGLKLEPEATATNQQKMEQVVAAAAELQAYLRQRVGIAAGGGKVTNLQLAPNYTGCHFAGGVPEPEEAEGDGE
jgi:hypothetical protein